MGELLWLDLETTALDPREGEILEVAIVWRGESWEWTIRPTQPLRLETLDPVLVEMHKASRLFEACESSGGTLADVERDLLRHIGDHERERGDKLTLAGFSVHFDLAWLRLHMPRLARHLAHRVYDVSTVARLAEELGWPRPEKIGAHRAGEDVCEAMAVDRACRNYLRSPGDRAAVALLSQLSVWPDNHPLELADARCAACYAPNDQGVQVHAAGCPLLPYAQVTEREEADMAPPG